MTALDALGLAAGAMTTIAFVPQVVKTWRSRSVRDLSLPMLAVLATGILLWLTYGVLRSDPSIIAANAATLALVAALMGMKVAFGRST